MAPSPVRYTLKLCKVKNMAGGAVRLSGPS
jgi:hypothetical protein